MRAEFKLMPIDHRFAGKIILTPETPEEETGLRAFRQEVGIPQKGRRLEIVYRRRVVGPEGILGVVQKIGQTEEQRS